jgi:phytoene synthase
VSPREHCRAIVRRSRSSFLPAFFFLTGRQRDALFAVYAYLRAVDDAIDDHPPAIARPMVDELKRQLERSASGHATHPAAVRLGEVAAACSLELDLVWRVVAGLEGDLEPARVATLADLGEYAKTVAGNLGVLLLPIFGVDGRGPGRPYAEALGTALQIINILRDVGEDADRARCYVPLEVLAAHGATTDDILGKKDTPGVRAAMASLRRRARIDVTRARALLPRAERARLAVPEIMADLYLAQLAQLEQLAQPSQPGQPANTANTAHTAHTAHTERPDAGGSPFVGAARVRRRTGLLLATWRYAACRVGRLSLPDAASA